MNGIQLKVLFTNINEVYTVETFVIYYSDEITANELCSLHPLILCVLNLFNFKEVVLFRGLLKLALWKSQSLC